MLRSKQGADLKSHPRMELELKLQTNVEPYHNSLLGWGLSCGSKWGRDKIKAQTLSRAKIVAKGGPRVTITSLTGLEQKSWPSIRTKQLSPPDVVPEPKNS